MSVKEETNVAKETNILQNVLDSKNCKVQIPNKNLFLQMDIEEKEIPKEVIDLYDSNVDVNDYVNVPYPITCPNFCNAVVFSDKIFQHMQVCKNPPKEIEWENVEEVEIYFHKMFINLKEFKNIGNINGSLCYKHNEYNFKFLILLNNLTIHFIDERYNIQDHKRIKNVNDVEEYIFSCIQEHKKKLINSKINVCV